MSIRCGHCGRIHNSTNEVRICAGPPVAITTPQHCEQDMLPYVYGLPGAGAFEAARRGEITLAMTCIVPHEAPNWKCTVCGVEERIMTPEQDAYARAKDQQRELDWSKFPTHPYRPRSGCGCSSTSQVKYDLPPFNTGRAHRSGTNNPLQARQPIGIVVDRGGGCKCQETADCCSSFSRYSPAFFSQVASSQMRQSLNPTQLSNAPTALQI